MHIRAWRAIEEGTLYYMKQRSLDVEAWLALPCNLAAEMDAAQESGCNSIQKIGKSLKATWKWSCCSKIICDLGWEGGCVDKVHMRGPVFRPPEPT